MARLGPPGTNDRICACTIDGATGNPIMVQGCAVARTGAGIYTVNLDTPANTAENVAFITAVDATPSLVTYAHTTDALKTITVVDQAGGAVDRTVHFAMFRLR
jgi:hypothetical protein